MKKEIPQNKMEYDSPSGSINIGKWEPPFAEVQDGYGFQGVIAEDSETGQLQCHMCGAWYENIPTHLTSTHRISSDDYKFRFGLFKSTALKSKRLRLRQSEVMNGMRKKHVKHRRKFSKNNTESGNRRGKPKAVESQNVYGVCELQVADKVKILAKKLGRTPKLTEVRDEYGGGFVTTIHSRYQGYINLCRKLNLEPGVSNHNPKFSKEYFINKGVEAYRKRGKWQIKEIYSENERRYIYKFFRGYEELKNTVEESMLFS